jgi:hypothetical protein
MRWGGHGHDPTREDATVSSRAQNLNLVPPAGGPSAKRALVWRSAHRSSSHGSPVGCRIHGQVRRRLTSGGSPYNALKACIEFRRQAHDRVGGAVRRVGLAARCARHTPGIHRPPTRVEAHSLQEHCRRRICRGWRAAPARTRRPRAGRHWARRDGAGGARHDRCDDGRSKRSAHVNDVVTASVDATLLTSRVCVLALAAWRELGTNWKPPDDAKVNSQNQQHIQASGGVKIGYAGFIPHARRHYGSSARAPPSPSPTANRSPRGAAEA